MELIQTRRIASLHIHVERAIERIRNYNITKFIAISLAPIADEIVFVLFLHFFNNRLYHHAHDICIHHTLHFISIKHCVCHTSYLLLCSYKVWEHVSKIKTTKFIYVLHVCTVWNNAFCEGDQTTKSQNSALVTKSWTWT